MRQSESDSLNRGAVRIRDVAELAGVSIGTVSNVVTGNRPVTAAYEAKVRKALDTLGYVPNDTARHLRTGSSRTIGLVLTDLTNPYFADLSLGAERAAAAAGYALLVGTSPDASDRETRYVDVFRRQRVDGILMTPQGLAHPSVEAIRGSGSKIVMVDRKDPDNRHCSVISDDAGGGAEAAVHLITSGRRRLWFVGAPVMMGHMQSRLDGFTSAVTHADSNVDLTIIKTDDLTIKNGLAIGERIATLPRTERPDGVFCANDLTALGVLASLRHHQISVPADIAVIGYDGIIFGETSFPELTTVLSPSADIGYTAVQMLLAELSEGAAHVHRHETLATRLLVRHSA